MAYHLGTLIKCGQMTASLGFKWLATPSPHTCTQTEEHNLPNLTESGTIRILWPKFI